MILSTNVALRFRTHQIKKFRVVRKEKPKFWDNSATFLAYSGIGSNKVGQITVKILTLPKQTVLLDSIKTYFINLNKDFGGNGIATVLLLAGMEWALTNGGVNLMGDFMPELDYRKTIEWYEKRNIKINQDSRLEGQVPEVIEACRNIISKHKTFNP